MVLFTSPLKTGLNHPCFLLDLETVLQRVNSSSPTQIAFSSPPSQQQQQLGLLVPKIETSTFEDYFEPDDDMIKSEDNGCHPSLLLCPICGNEAGKHVHYGGRACTSCRAFFRRSVQVCAISRYSPKRNNMSVIWIIPY